MGKQALATPQARIHEAMLKAVEDGYRSNNLVWHVTSKSLSDFQCCADYVEKSFDPHNEIDKAFHGMIWGIDVYTNPALSGHLAELRNLHGDRYSITLDFAADQPANTDYAQLRAWRQERE